MITSTLENNVIESKNPTATLMDELKRGYFETFDPLLVEFDRRFTDNLPILRVLEALDRSLTKFMDVKFLKWFSAVYGELDIDDILFKSLAYIAKNLE